ncbi:MULTISPECIES: hypothetical protein [Actinomycetes]|uniref:phage fiber-tail adaptor protein n=1 Tax=Actinomycetes TaxID=1760 RepID=UPI001152A0D6|nr:hypothetical protein [Arthrobacter sp. SLBN-53]TQK29368.1 hypothetical protein FBY28_2371 [Arthrobacter sp. SLBN-53]
MATITDRAEKDPDDVCPFTVDWSDWLAVTEDLILDCDVFADGLDIHDCWFTGQDTTAKLGGGSDNAEYEVTFRIYTEAEDVYDYSIIVRCESH